MLSHLIAYDIIHDWNIFHNHNNYYYSWFITTSVNNCVALEWSATLSEINKRWQPIWMRKLLWHHFQFINGKHLVYLNCKRIRSLSAWPLLIGWTPRGNSIGSISASIKQVSGLITWFWCLQHNRTPWINLNIRPVLIWWITLIFVLFVSIWVK